MYDVYKTSVNSLRRAVNKVSQKFLTFFDSVLTFQIYFNPLRPGRKSKKLKLSQKKLKTFEGLCLSIVEESLRVDILVWTCFARFLGRVGGRGWGEGARMPLLCRADPLDAAAPRRSTSGAVTSP